MTAGKPNTGSEDEKMQNFVNKGKCVVFSLVYALYSLVYTLSLCVKRPFCTPARSFF